MLYMKDALGDRMKSRYEHRARAFLPRRTYTLLRIDGKAFHSYTRQCTRPFDEDLITLMNATAKGLCEGIQGAKVGYVQSDEISLLLTDFETPQTDAWFDGNVQKITSVSASMATALFNEARYQAVQDRVKEKFQGAAMFDSRVWTIPDYIEVENYFVWRQQDASRNSVNMVAQTHFSHKELQGKSIPEVHDMLHAKSINWNDFAPGFKRGRAIVRGAERGWEVVAPPVFTQDRAFLKNCIPIHWEAELNDEATQ